MEKRIVIITGANSGIGKAAALKFATEGYRVIMACRNIEISRKVQEEIIGLSHNESVELMKLDVSSFDSIQSFCVAYHKKYSKLDILIHNAAYANHGEKYRLSPDQIELTFATNVFGPFLLTHLLLDRLKKSDDPRILHACSNIVKHFLEPKRKIAFDNLQGEFKDKRPHSVYQMYCNSKMALLMLTFKMASEFKNDGIKVNALQINGAKMSKETLKKFKPWWRIIARIQNIYFPLPAVMGNAYFDICSSKEFQHTTGKLFNDKRGIMLSSVNQPSPLTQVKQLLGSNVYPVYADNPNTIGKIWEISNELTKAYLK